MGRMLRPTPEHLDGTKQLINQIKLVKKNKKRPNGIESIRTEDPRELQNQSSLTITPVITSDIELSHNKLLKPARSMKVSFIKVPKPSIVESQLLSPSIIDLDEHISNLQNTLQ